MIDERIYMLDLINMQLAESMAYTDTRETEYRFHRECQARPIAFEHCWGRSISEVYAVDVALGGLRESVGNGIWPKDIDYHRITSINELGAAMYYNDISRKKRILIKIACEEIKMVKKLIETNILKYERITENTGEIDIYSLDQTCADLDKTVGYI